ncbi:MAG: patatin-like phospholipase family protein [Bacteroidota bacterium]
MTNKVSHLEEKLYDGRKPRRILALDGGGIRGALTLGFLEEIERVIQAQPGNEDKLLCDYFDLIIGTSTGSIIASGLAIGLTARQIKDQYLTLGGTIFSKRRKPWLPGVLRYALRAEYRHNRLVEGLEETFGGTTLGDNEKIKTGLAIVAKRADTFSTWVFNNFQRAPFYYRNKELRLVDLIRASTAAPSYFEPHILNVGGSNPLGAFIDGGVSLANNPSFQALMLASIKGYSLGWSLKEDDFMIVSVGTGTGTKQIASQKLRRMPIFRWGKVIPNLFMEDASYFNQALLQWLSDSPTAIEIDRVVKDLRDDYFLLGLKPLNYVRYNVKMDVDYLQEELGMEFTPAQVEHLREMDKGENRFTLAEIGEGAARIQVKTEHFEPKPVKRQGGKLLFNTYDTPDLPFKKAVKKAIPIQYCKMDEPFLVNTLEGIHSGEAGDYLVIGTQGELYPIKKDIFEKTYDALP